MTHRFSVFVPVLAAAALAAPPAQASGLSTARFGGEHGNPMTDNPTAIYYNPAGIGLSNGLTVFADGNIAFRYARYEHNERATNAPSDFPEPNDGIGANYGKAGLFNVAAAPMLGATAKFDMSESVDLAVGAGFFVPFGGASRWDQNDAFAGHPKYAGPVDGVARWYSIDGTFRLIYVSAAAAVSIKDFIHLGVSGGVSIDKLDTVRAFTGGKTNELDQEGRAWIEASGVSPQLGGGVMVTPLEDKDKLRIGLSYQAPPGFGALNFRGELAKYTPNGGPQSSEVDVHQNFPDIWRLGASYRLTKDFELRLFGDYTRWSLFTDQCFAPVGDNCEIGDNGEPIDSPTIQVAAKRDWDDAFGVRFGASYWVRPTVEVFAGVGYDSNAIPDENLDPAILDFDDIGAALGSRIELVDWLAAALSYTHFFYIPRTIDTGATVNSRLDATSRYPDASGTYKQSIGVVNVNLEGSWDLFGGDEAKAAAR